MTAQLAPRTIKHVNGRIVGEIAPPRPAGREPSGLAPASIEAEEAVLGACLISQAVPLDVSSILAAEHFSRPPHAALYAVMLAMTADGTPIDIATLAAELERRGAMGDVGGIVAVVTLLERTPLAAHARHYAEIVRRRAADRAVIGAAGEIARIAYDGEDKALDKAQAILAKLDYDLGETETGDLSDALADLVAPRPAGWSTGMGVIDHWLGDVGLVPGRSLVVSGAPGVGKTTLATSFLVEALAQGARVSDFTLEMTRAERVIKMGGPLVGRRARRLGEIPADKWTDFDRATYAEIEAVLRSMPGTIKIYHNQRDAGKIAALARRDRADVVMVDFYGQLLFERQRGENTDEVDKRNAETLALHLPKRGNCCVMIVSQLNKDGTLKYGSWLNAFAHAHLHMDPIDGTTRIKVEPRKNRWGPNSSSGASAEFDADLAAGTFKQAMRDG